MRSWILLLIGILAFSILGSFRKMADEWPSILLAFLRMAGAVFILKFFVFRSKLKPVKNRKTWIEFAIIGILMALAFTLYMEAFVHTNISDIKIVGFLDPILVLFFASIFLHEKVSRYSVAAAALAMVGLLFLVVPAGGEHMEGLFMALLAMFCGAAMTILIRKTEHDAPISEVLIYPFGFGATFCLLWMLVSSVNLSLVDWTLWPWVLGMVVSTAVSYYAYDTAMSKVGAHVADLAMRIGIALFGTVFAIWITGEVLSPQWIFAAICLVLAVGVMTFDKKTKRHPYRHEKHGHTH